MRKVWGCKKVLRDREIWRLKRSERAQKTGARESGFVRREEGKRRVLRKDNRLFESGGGDEGRRRHRERLGWEEASLQNRSRPGQEKTLFERERLRKEMDTLLGWERKERFGELQRRDLSGSSEKRGRRERRLLQRKLFFSGNKFQVEEFII